jgi:hypothetical protein
MRRSKDFSPLVFFNNITRGHPTFGRGKRAMTRFLCIAFLLSLANISFAQSPNETSFEIETEGSYLLSDLSSEEIAQKVSIYDAKKQAVKLAAKYLSAKALIGGYGSKTNEIYSLAARGVLARLIEERWEAAEKEKRYVAHIRATVQVSDFVQAEMEDREAEKEELKESYREEMEQPVPKNIDPGKDISKAYRLLRERKWRLATIYLDHLETKYPDWNEIYMAKAIAHYAENQPLQMKKALEKACRLGCNEACEELNNFKKFNDISFE